MTMRFASLLVLALGARAFPEPTPLYQSTEAGRAAPKAPLTLRDAARDDRWLGVPVRDIRWSLDGGSVYFRWHPSPSPKDLPDADPWYRADRSGASAEPVPAGEVHAIPSETPSRSRDGQRACWSREGSLYLYEAGSRSTVQVLSLSTPVTEARILPDGSACDFLLEENLNRYDIARRTLAQLTRKEVEEEPARSGSDAFRENEEAELFARTRDSRERESKAEDYRKALEPGPIQILAVPPGTVLEDVRLSPDGRFVTFRARKPSTARRMTRYMDYVTRTGDAEPREARPKVGDAEDESRLGIVTMGGSKKPTWVDTSSFGPDLAIVHGPYWSPEGDRALVQILSTGHKDRWIAELDVETARTTSLVHDHDDAWLGGPPPVAGYLEPALLEWLPGGRFVFASERSGWSHLYLVEPGGKPRALTEGPWEVRDAKLSRDRSRWLLTASREHPCDDHLYSMPAAGGDLVRLTEKPGRSNGFLSPDGGRLAVLHSEAMALPDLYLRDVSPGSAEARVTASGTDNHFAHEWVAPEVVSFPHPDGAPVWAALYTPARPAPERPAVLHIHGGGYRQFSHRGYSVYGYGLHLGLLQYLVQSGYTVLDLDYRGSAGFGRDYRTDIYRSMGGKDVESAVAAADYLVRERGVDRSRIGIYGVSYGGFLTLMSQFRHPGVFAAGVANAAVTDWAHYQDRWTRRILNLPGDDPEAYRFSSPIYHAEGLKDRLLLVHGLIDDNVQFQDAARLMQKFIELEKPFEVMVYPTERHTIETEASRYDYNRRLMDFFERYLRR